MSCPFHRNLLQKSKILVLARLILHSNTCISHRLMEGNVYSVYTPTRYEYNIDDADDKQRILEVDLLCPPDENNNCDKDKSGPPGIHGCALYRTCKLRNEINAASCVCLSNLLLNWTQQQE